MSKTELKFILVHKIVAQKLKDAYLKRFSYGIGDVMINLVGVTGKTVPFQYLVVKLQGNASHPFEQLMQVVHGLHLPLKRVFQQRDLVVK